MAKMALELLEDDTVRFWTGVERGDEEKRYLIVNYDLVDIKRLYTMFGKFLEKYEEKR